MRQRQIQIIFSVMILATSAVIAADREKSISPEEYAVYSAILNRIEPSPSDGKKARLVIINNKTSGPIKKELVTEVGVCEKALVSPAMRALVNDLFGKNQRNYAIDKRLALSRKYILISTDRFSKFFETRGAGGWDDYYQQYPHGTGFNTLSRVGFGADQKQALVYMEVSCNVICGYFSFIYLRKVKGHWKVIAEYDCNPTR